jgi:alpha-L-fucosidase 2
MKKNLQTKMLSAGLLIIAGWYGVEGRAADYTDLRLHYDKPAGGRTEALPLGNGRLGCLVFGNVEQERIPFNENSLWSGDAKAPAVPERFGELALEFEPDAARGGVTDYRRELSIDEAESRVTFKRNGVTHIRTIFVSQPDLVLIVRWQADRPGAVNGVLRLRGAHGETTRAAGSTVGFTGTLANGMQYEARAQVYAKGGKLEASDGVFHLRGCDEVWVALAAETGYVMKPARPYPDDSPSARIDEVLSEVSRFGFDLVRMRHLAHHQCFFRQVRLDLGSTSLERRSMTTDRRLAEYAKDGADPELEALLFQFGRYLLLSSSHRTGLPEKYIPKQTFGWYPGAALRPGLPALAHGLWHDGNTTGYQADGSLQMSYWAAEPANVDKCHLPLFDLIRSQREPWSRNWEQTANAWLCRHLWQHYEFIGTPRGKQVYLEGMAYPILKAACEFWENRLKTLPDGRLGVEGGTGGDQEIVWDLFNNYAEVCAALKFDVEYGGKIAGMRDKLALSQVGGAGTERDLFGVYPGGRINRVKMPELAKEAATALTALEAKNSGESAITVPWRCALWARLGEGGNAYRQIRGFMAGNLNPNLCSGKPALRVDGNLGMTGAMCELLLQSHAGTLELLPALPAVWPEGSVKGLKAPGGLLVDIEWKAGKVTSYNVTAYDQAAPVSVTSNGETQVVTPVKGDNLIEFQGW